MKVFSHRFHFSNPSLLTLTVTHYKDQVVIYARKGRLYMSISEPEFRDLIHSLKLVKGKIHQCKRVMLGREPPLMDIEDQSSTLPKSEATIKIERDRSRSARARQALVLEMTDNEDYEDSLPKPKKRCIKTVSHTDFMEVNRSDDDSDAAWKKKCCHVFHLEYLLHLDFWQHWRWFISVWKDLWAAGSLLHSISFPITFPNWNAAQFENQQSFSGITGMKCTILWWRCRRMWTRTHLPPNYISWKNQSWSMRAVVQGPTPPSRSVTGAGVHLLLS